MLKTKNLTTKNPKGFTLVELVIVIAIVIILSVISVPIYRGYVDKSKMAEGYALLGTILSAQKAYFSEYGNFLLVQHSCAGNAWQTCNETVLGIDARGNKYFTKFWVGCNVERVNDHYFDAYVCKPADLATPDSLYIILQYNTTLGARMANYTGWGAEEKKWSGWS